MLKKCLFCGKEFNARKNKRMFCSIACSNKSRNNKKYNEFVFNDEYIEIKVKNKDEILKAKIDFNDYEKCKNIYWFVSNNYVVGQEYIGNKTFKRFFLHRFIANLPSLNEDRRIIDHINHNTLDNRKCNLRICTHSENNRNRKYNNITTGIYKRWKHYEVYWKNKYIKSFKTLEEAIELRKNLELENPLPSALN